MSLPPSVFLSLNPFLRSPHSTSLLWGDVCVNPHRTLSPDRTGVRAPEQPVQRLEGPLQERAGPSTEVCAMAATILGSY